MQSQTRGLDFVLERREGEGESEMWTGEVHGCVKVWGKMDKRGKGTEVRVKVKDEIRESMDEEAKKCLEFILIGVIT